MLGTSIQCTLIQTHKYCTQREAHTKLSMHTPIYSYMSARTHTRTHTVLKMAQTSWGTQLATITPPEMNHLLLISAHSPPPEYSSQLDFRIFLFSNHFHKSLLIDPRIAPDWCFTPVWFPGGSRICPLIIYRVNKPVALINFHLIVTCVRCIDFLDMTSPRAAN